jgi:hypothetical protein
MITETMQKSCGRLSERSRARTQSLSPSTHNARSDRHHVQHLQQARRRGQLQEEAQHHERRQKLGERKCEQNGKARVADATARQSELGSQ